MNHKQNLIKVLSQILVEPNIYTSSTSEKQTQSSVAIILKNIKTVNLQTNSKFQILEEHIHYFLDTEILFLQRVINHKAYSGDVCLPGGKVDRGQLPLQASIRQTEEETSIKLNQGQLIGVANKRFLAYQRGEMQLYTYVYLFFIQRQVEVKLNLKQITAYKWVPLKHFLNPSVYKLMKITQSPILNKLGYQHFQHHISHIQWPSVEVGLSKNLYGLTFYILAHFTNEIIHVIIQYYAKLCKVEAKIIENSYQIDQDKRHIFFRTKMLFQNCFISAMRFKNYYFEKWQLIFEQNCPYSQDQKSKVEVKFRQSLQNYFSPPRPRF